MIKTWIAVGVVALIAVFAAADALRSNPPPPEAEAATTAPAAAPPELRGPDVPAPGTLPGILYFAGLGGCRLQAVSFASLDAGPAGDETRCGLWVSPHRPEAIVALDRVARTTGREIWLATLDGRPELMRRIGTARGDVSWSTDGDRVAWCDERGRTVVVSLSRNFGSELEGCKPKIAPDGAVLTRPDEPLVARLLRNGSPYLQENQLARGFAPVEGGRLDVLGYDQSREGVLAVAVVRFNDSTPETVLELWRGGELEGTIRLPLLGDTGSFGTLGQLVQFSPAGTEVAVGFPGEGFRLGVWDVRTGRQLLPLTSQHGFAWSPDSTWFALSTAEELLVYGTTRDEPVYSLPIEASAIAWR